MGEEQTEPSLLVRLVRSFTPLTAALIGATAAVSYVLGAAAFALTVGQSPPNAADIAGALAIVVTLVAVFGIVAGLVAQAVLRLTSNAGMADWRLVKRSLAIVAALSAILGIRTAWTYEAPSWVRVVLTSPGIARIDGPSTLMPRTPAWCSSSSVSCRRRR